MLRGTFHRLDSPPLNLAFLSIFLVLSSLLLSSLSLFFLSLELSLPAFVANVLAISHHISELIVHS